MGEAPTDTSPRTQGSTGRLISTRTAALVATGVLLAAFVAVVVDPPWITSGRGFEWSAKGHALWWLTRSASVIAVAASLLYTADQWIQREDDRAAPAIGGAAPTRGEWIAGVLLLVTSLLAPPLVVFSAATVSPGLGGVLGPFEVMATSVTGWALIFGIAFTVITDRIHERAYPTASQRSQRRFRYAAFFVLVVCAVLVARMLVVEITMESVEIAPRTASGVEAG